MTRQEWLRDALDRAAPLTTEQKLALSDALPPVIHENGGLSAVDRKTEVVLPQG